MPSKLKKKPKAAAAPAAPAEPPKPLRLEYLDPAELAENPLNWRSHPPHQVASLEAAMSEVGWAGALLFNERSGRLIDGHARRKLFAGKGLVPVLIGSWDDEAERKILATLDPLGALAEMDGPALDVLLAGVTTENSELDKMLAELKVAIPAVATATPEEEIEPTEDPEDDLDLLFKSPYPWFGGKSRVAGMVWRRFGG